MARVGRSDYKTLTYLYNTVNSGTGFSRYPLRCTAADLTIDELFGNIAQYAYHPGTGPATVRVETAEDPLAVIITFIDKSVKFDPLAKEDPDISLSMEERGIGGLGIYMMKRTMDGASPDRGGEGQPEYTRLRLPEKTSGSSPGLTRF